MEILSQRRDTVLSCPTCGGSLENNRCAKCSKAKGSSIEHYFDPDFDEYFSRIESENEGIETDTSKMKWEEITEDELDKLGIGE